MIEIIKKPKERFVTCCPQCGCVFAYEFKDIDEVLNMVGCPACGELIGHVVWSRYEIENTRCSENGEVIKALEKQIPKKPIKNEWDYTCPTCGQKQIDDDEDVNLYYPHCFNCGQRLNWEGL